MQNNSTIKERILQYLEFKGVTQYEFYKETGVSRGTLANKSGLSEDNTAKFIDYAKDVNVEWLFLNKGKMLRENLTEYVKEEKSPYKKGKNLRNDKMPEVVTVDSHGHQNIVLVPYKAAAGYLLGYDDRRFLQKLPTFNLPMLTNGTFRMFEVHGHSMINTLHSGSYVIGEFCENWEEEVKDNQIYVVVSREDGIVVKRVLNRINKYGSLYLKSDNRKEYPSYSLEIKEVQEIWKVKMGLIYELPDPADVYDRLNDLEAEMLQLKQKTRRTHIE